MYNRYLEIKRIYKEYIILIRKKEKLLSFGEDSRILSYLNITDKKKRILNRYKINYLVLDNLDIEEFKSFDGNRYLEYYIKSRLYYSIRKYY